MVKINSKLKYRVRFKIEQSSVRELNPQFSLCDVLVCYHGDNRNRSSISKEVIDNALYSLYGVPMCNYKIRTTIAVTIFNI